MIRAATAADVPAITDIMNALLATTTYEWTEEPHDPIERVSWLRRHEEVGEPVLVAELDGEVVGWAAYGDFRDTARWPGYSSTVEHSVHVREDRWGHGVGRALLEALMDAARAAGKRVTVGAIDGSNEPSIRFHEHLGFEIVGRLPGVGDKFGRELDLVLVQRRLVP